MNARILELIKTPQLLQEADLRLLDKEMESLPYAQSIRALHLLGTHSFNVEKYKQELSVTAAYTTDKKILYHLINRETATEKTELLVEDDVTDNEIGNATEIQPGEASIDVQEKDMVVSNEADANIANKYTAIEMAAPVTPQPVYVGGELNRILFEGEEDFLERETEVIDIESTLESGQITVQKPTEENNIIQPVEEAEQVVEEVADTETFSTEEVISEENPASLEQVEQEPELSFHGLDEFLPEVKIVPTPSSAVIFEAPKPQVNRHEEEMKRLIAEVEAKMKAAKKEKLPIVEEEEVTAGEINFAENHDEPIVVNEAVQPTVEETSEKEVQAQQQEIVSNKTTPDSEWKPMSFVSGTPDALISVSKKEVKAEEKPEPKTEQPVQAEEKALNISFFNTEVKPIEEVKTLAEEEKEPAKKEETSSNVTGFITTWQNWLKIGKQETETAQTESLINDEVVVEKEEPVVEDIKTKVIENFIETEPRISKLKEESDFVVKERNDDISHLMTETLAGLYVEQKLYAKAIKAYEALAQKHPDKAAYFKDKIKETKDLRQNK